MKRSAEYHQSSSSDDRIEDKSVQEIVKTPGPSPEGAFYYGPYQDPFLYLKTWVPKVYMDNGE